MSKENAKKIIYLVLVIIWMIAVFMFSNQKGDESQKTSNTVTKIIVKILTYNQNISENEEETLIEKTDYIVRKIAHFSIYLLGGVLIYNYINTFDIETKKKIIISIVIGILYAVFDEFHQYFVGGRSARIFDVCIDSLGIIAGVTIIYLTQKNKSL